MDTATTAPTIDIPALLPSWQRSLKAANRSPRTIQSYTESAEQLADFLARQGMPAAVGSVRREHVEAYIVDLQTQVQDHNGFGPVPLAAAALQVDARRGRDRGESDGADARSRRR